MGRFIFSLDGRLSKFSCNALGRSISMLFSFYNAWWWFKFGFCIFSAEITTSSRALDADIRLSTGLLMDTYNDGAIKNDLRTIWSPYKMIAYIMNFVHNDRLLTAYWLSISFYTGSFYTYTNIYVGHFWRTRPYI